MPIGFDPGDGGGGGSPPPAPPPSDPLDPWAHPPDDGADGWSEPAGEEGGSWTWVAVEEEEVFEVVFERWDAHFDTRVCPECWTLDGEVWERGAGPHPPLHPSCRCARVYDHSEWQTRVVTVWEQQWVPA